MTKKSLKIYRRKNNKYISTNTWYLIQRSSLYRKTYQLKNMRNSRLRNVHNKKEVVKRPTEWRYLWEDIWEKWKVFRCCRFAKFLERDLENLDIKKHEEHEMRYTRRLLQHVCSMLILRADMNSKLRIFPFIFDFCHHSCRFLLFCSKNKFILFYIDCSILFYK